jgi:hypothetical protein
VNHFLKFLLILIFFSNEILAQQFGDTYFEKLPQDLQLYPRNSQNQALIVVNGKNTNVAVQSISLLISRNNQPFAYQIVNISSNGGNFLFTTTINAELAEYGYKVYAKTSNTDSTLIVSRANIVAGDAYLVTGQSNAYNGQWNETGTALNSQLYQGEYARSFGVFTHPDNYGDYNPTDTTWKYSNKNGNVVGMWATELQKLIIEKYNVPICIFRVCGLTSK